jgi:hypothetical protein
MMSGGGSLVCGAVLLAGEGEGEEGGGGEGGEGGFHVGDHFRV